MMKPAIIQTHLINCHCEGESPKQSLWRLLRRFAPRNGNGEVAGDDNVKRLSALVLITLIPFIQISQARANEELRDPFVSLGDKLALSQGPAEVVQLPYPIILKGTLCAKNTYAAIVNNDIIRQGERWQDFYVVKIEKGLVILEWRDKQFEIRLAPEKEIMSSEKISGKYVPSQPERKIRPK